MEQQNQLNSDTSLVAYLSDLIDNGASTAMRDGVLEFIARKDDDGLNRQIIEVGLGKKNHTAILKHYLFALVEQGKLARWRETLQSVLDKRSAWGKKLLKETKSHQDWFSLVAHRKPCRLRVEDVRNMRLFLEKHDIQPNGRPINSYETSAVVAVFKHLEMLGNLFTEESDAAEVKSELEVWQTRLKGVLRAPQHKEDSIDMNSWNDLSKYEGRSDLRVQLPSCVLTMINKELLEGYHPITSELQILGNDAAVEAAKEALVKHLKNQAKRVRTTTVFEAWWSSLKSFDKEVQEQLLSLGVERWPGIHQSFAQWVEHKKLSELLDGAEQASHKKKVAATL
jgi:hypothetical protein